MLDIEMGGMTGVELARKLRSDGAEVQLVFITGDTDFIADGYEVANYEIANKIIHTYRTVGVYCDYRHMGSNIAACSAECVDPG